MPNKLNKLYLLFFFHLSFALNLKLPVEELLQSLTLEQKIGQLFMVATVSDEQLNRSIKLNEMVMDYNFMLNSPYTMEHEYIEKLITNYHIGGIIFLGAGTIEAQQKCVNHFQKLAPIPLLVGQDLEWGLNMRLYDGIQFPKNIVLGTIKNNKLIYQLGKEIGRQCKAVGVHINFAPVVDINNNPDNPVIKDRSFGKNKKNVAQKGIAFMCGLQDAGIIACAKHFPGHGDTCVDSHEELPCIKHDKTRLDTIELYPFVKLLNAGVQAVMLAHLNVPALDSILPTSLSKNVIKLLKDQLEFNGLIFPDGLGMKALTNHFQPGEIELQALMAGNDMLLCPVDVPKAVTKIKEALSKGLLSEQEINVHVLKILKAKKKVFEQGGFEPVNYPITYINSPYAKQLQKKLYENAIYPGK